MTHIAMNAFVTESTPSDSVKHVDIAIVGGGMVGASMANLLAKSLPQHTIALIESQSPPLFKEKPAKEKFISHFDARSTALSYGSAAILRELGIWDEVHQHVTAIRKIHVSDRGHYLGGTIEADTKNKRDAVGYVVENQWLIQVLQSHLQQHNNIQCFYNISATQLTFLSDAAQLTLTNLEKMGVEKSTAPIIKAELVIIADGSDSPLRQSLGITTQLQEYHQAAIIANVEFSEPHAGIAYERFTDQGPLALLPLGESDNASQAALVWTLPTTKAQEIYTLSNSDFMAQLQTRFGFRVGFFKRMSARVLYPLQLVLAEEQIRSRLVLIGNAAHFLHPVAGQGFNLALRDCTCLAETLQQAVMDKNTLGDLAVLRAYVEKQSVDQQLTIEFSDKLVRLFSNRQMSLTALRHLGLLSLEFLPQLKALFVAQTTGLGGRRARL